MINDPTCIGFDNAQRWFLICMPDRAPTQDGDVYVVAHHRNGPQTTHKHITDAARALAKASRADVIDNRSVVLHSLTDIEREQLDAAGMLPQEDRRHEQ